MCYTIVFEVLLVNVSSQSILSFPKGGDVWQNVKKYMIIHTYTLAQLIILGAKHQCTALQTIDHTQDRILRYKRESCGCRPTIVFSGKKKRTRTKTILYHFNFSSTNMTYSNKLVFIKTETFKYLKYTGI